jgi:hypothetical protein
LKDRRYYFTKWYIKKDYSSNSLFCSEISKPLYAGHLLVFGVILMACMDKMLMILAALVALAVVVSAARAVAAPVVPAFVVSLIDCFPDLNLQVPTSVPFQASAKRHYRLSFFVQSFIFVSLLCSSPELAGDARNPLLPFLQHIAGIYFPC